MRIEPRGASSRRFKRFHGRSTGLGVVAGGFLGFQGISGEFQGVSLPSPGEFMPVLEATQRVSNVFLWVSGAFKGVSEVSQGCFKGVPVGFREYREVKRAIKGSLGRLKVYSGSTSGFH